MKRERRRTRFSAAALLVLLLSAANGGAQRTPPDSVREGGHSRPLGRPREMIVAGLALAGAAATDERVRHWAVTHRSADLDRAAHAGNVLGRGRVMMSAMLVAYVGARIARRPRLARTVVRAAASYAIGNAAASALKSAVGRHRPEGADDPWRFRPFSRDDAWHSFSSSHVAHVATVAALASAESRRPWVTGASSAAVALVGFSRVYSDAHWTSDAVASAEIGVLSARLARRLVPECRGQERLR
ncbi:MAG: phosphatase PAP2 family protein [Gemmatimonadaceae bacterium]